MIKIILANSSHFSNFQMLEFFIQKTIKELSLDGYDVSRENLELVICSSKETEKLATRFAKKYEIRVKRFTPGWEKYGKGARCIRNREMCEYANKVDYKHTAYTRDTKCNLGMLIAFWDYRSKGTKNIIDIAVKLNLKVKTIRIDPESVE